eukprot:TRINITY_DN9505_c0_g1_i1.p2 TRINITY_DN9505_c0_g1~~TRINITY_DN9505_c0_g1_i1.p2  ORF type:complete len:129 (-),score=44.27 TRINITY_DN9505_c0_g1_i1:25-411(-)
MDKYLPSLNVNRLQETSMDDREFEEELLEIFVSNIDSQIENLKNSLTNKNWEESYDISHTIKGSSAQLGGDQVSLISKEIEGELGNPHVSKEKPNEEKFERAFKKFQSLEIETKNFIDIFKEYLNDSK